MGHRVGGFGSAWVTARLVAAAKWRTVRSATSKAWLWVGLLAVASGLSLAAQVGDLVRLVAETDGQSTVQGVVASAYLRQWVQTGFGAIASTVLVFCLAVTVVTPLVAPSAPTLMPAHELVGVRTSRMHPYVSALVVHVTSVVTFVQLLALTALAGLLSLDGSGRTRAVVLSWVGWLVLVVVSQAVLWGSRVVRRTRRADVLVLLVLLGSGVLVTAVVPGSLVSVFGAVPVFTWWLLDASVVVSVAGAVLVGAVCGWAGWSWCSRVVSAPVTVAPVVNSGRGGPMPVRPVHALVTVVVRSFVRTGPIVAPLVAVTALAAAGVLVAGHVPAAVWAVGVGLPVVVGLAWTDNAAAMTGDANAWLASLPGQSRRLLGVWAGWAFLVTMILVAVAVTPGVLVGRVPVLSAVSAVLTAVAVTSLVTVVCLWHAVHRPAPARTVKGDGMLSASRAASASLRLLVGPGLVGWLATSASGTVNGAGVLAPVGVQSLGAGLCVLGAAGIGAVVAYRWSNPRVRAACLSAAS